MPWAIALYFILLYETMNKVKPTVYRKLFTFQGTPFSNINNMFIQNILKTKGKKYEESVLLIWRLGS